MTLNLYASGSFSSKDLQPPSIDYHFIDLPLLFDLNQDSSLSATAKHRTNASLTLVHDECLFPLELILVLGDAVS